MAVEITRPRFLVVSPHGRSSSKPRAAINPAPRPAAEAATLPPVKPGRGAAIRRINAARSKGYEPKPEDVDTVEETDLPTMIVNATKEGMEAGNLQPQIKDGIAAQAILERRQERMEDKAFILNLARAMAGGGIVQPRMVGPEIIEGEDILALAPEHMRVG